MGIYQQKALAVNQTEAVYWTKESNMAESHPELLCSFCRVWTAPCERLASQQPQPGTVNHLSVSKRNLTTCPSPKQEMQDLVLVSDFVWVFFFFSLLPGSN